MKLLSISPKPATVAELFTRYPEVWTQNVMFRNGGGYNCGLLDAVKCCFGGAINFIYGTEAVLRNKELEAKMKFADNQSANKAFAKKHFAFTEACGLPGCERPQEILAYTTLASFNDYEKTSLADVIDMAKAAEL